MKLLRLGLVGSLLSLAACSTMESMLPGELVDYKQSRSINALEVPPDLTSSTIDDSMMVPDLAPASGSASFSAYSSEREGDLAVRQQGVLPQVADIEVKRDGERRWLVIQGSADAVWEKARGFWLDKGFLLTIADPRIGIMETDWAENRADIPQGPVRSLIGKVFDSIYSAATRDKFRVRIERGLDGNTTELFLTHYGAEEVDRGETVVWQPRPSDPELEAEMLSRMMIFFGVEKQRAQSALARSKSQGEARARLIKDVNGAPLLQIDVPPAQSWRLVGQALDRVGFAVEDRNRSEWTYFVRYHSVIDEQEEGILSKLAFWKGEEKVEGRYQVVLSGQGERSEVVVLAEQGGPAEVEIASRILGLLQEQLK